MSASEEDGYLQLGNSPSEFSEEGEPPEVPLADPTPPPIEDDPTPPNNDSPDLEIAAGHPLLPVENAESGKEGTGENAVIDNNLSSETKEQPKEEWSAPQTEKAVLAASLAKEEKFMGNGYVVQCCTVNVKWAILLCGPYK